MPIDLIVGELREKLPELFEQNDEPTVKASLLAFINTFQYRADIVCTQEDGPYLRAIKRLVLKHWSFPRKPSPKKEPRVYIAPAEKKCTKCKEIKNITQFDKLPSGVHKPACAKCIYNLYQRPSTLKRLRRQGKVPKCEMPVMTDEEKRVKRSETAKLPRNKIARSLRGRLSKAVKGRGGKSKVGLKDLGCTKAELVAHLESKFKAGMSWDNYGEWEIDHIRPIASFNLLDSDELKLAANYQNLEPIWKSENSTKTSYWNGVKYAKGKPI